MNFDQALTTNALTPGNYKGLVPDRYETAYVCNNNRTNMRVLLPPYTNTVFLCTCNNRLSENVPSTRMQQNVVNFNQDNMCFSGLNTSIRNDHCISSCGLSSDHMHATKPTFAEIQEVSLKQALNESMENLTDKHSVTGLEVSGMVGILHQLMLNHVRAQMEKIK